MSKETGCRRHMLLLFRMPLCYMHDNNVIFSIELHKYWLNELIENHFRIDLYTVAVSCTLTLLVPLVSLSYRLIANAITWKCTYIHNISMSIAVVYARFLSNMIEYWISFVKVEKTMMYHSIFATFFPSHPNAIFFLTFYVH